MVTVTENAKKVLKAILVATETDRDKGLRLLPDITGNFTAVLTTELSGDLVVEYEGYKVLFIGIEYFKLFEAKTIDCQNTVDGTVLFVR